MYIVTSCDEALGYVPSLMNASPPIMILELLQRQARRSSQFFSRWLDDGDGAQDKQWLMNVMVSDDILKSCDVVLHFSDIVINKKRPQSYTATTS